MTEFQVEISDIIKLIREGVLELERNDNKKLRLVLVNDVGVFT